MKIEFTDNVKKDVADRLRYKAKSAKVEYFVAEAMQDERAMKIYQNEYDKAMNWLVAHGLA